MMVLFIVAFVLAAVSTHKENIHWNIVFPVFDAVNYPLASCMMAHFFEI